MGELVIRNGLKLVDPLPSGTGDSVLTVDGATSAVGSIGAIDTSVFVSKTLPSANIYVGNGSNVATAVAVSGDITLDNAGVAAIASGVIVNADINASAAIAFSKMAALTASRALVTDGSGLVSVSAVTATELGYLSGVTSAIQTQLGAKQATITGGATSITSANLTASRALVSDGSGKVGVATTTSTEIGYVNGVTSAIQTQLDGKQPDIQFKDEGVNAGTSGGVTAIDFVGAGVSAVESAGTLTVTIAGTANGLPSGGTAGQYLRKSSGTDYDAAWDTFTISDVTDITATAAEINALAGAGVSSAEMGYLSTVTSNIQDQLDLKLNRALTNNYMFVGNASNVAIPLATGANGYVLTSVGGVPTWVAPGSGGTVTSVDVSGGTTGLTTSGGPVSTSGTITLTGTLIAANGGTGFASYTVGDILYADTTTTLAKLGAGTSTYVLTSNGPGVAPSWQASGASGAWLLASGGTLTGANTITSNTQNQLNFTGTWTATANNAYMAQFGGLLTSRTTADDFLSAYLFNPTITGGASNRQYLTGVAMSPAFVGGADNTDFYTVLDITPTFSGGTTSGYGIYAAAATTGSWQGVRIQNTSTGSALIGFGAANGSTKLTSTNAYIERLNGTNGNFQLVNSGTGDIVFNTGNGSYTARVSGAGGRVSARNGSTGGLAIWNGSADLVTITSNGGNLSPGIGMDFNVSAGYSYYFSGHGKFRVVQSALSASHVPALEFTYGAHTSIANTSELINNDFSAVTQTWAGGGTVATQRGTYFRSQTLAGASAQTFTDAYTLYVDPPVAGTNATITNNWAAGFNGNTLITGNTFIASSGTITANTKLDVRGISSGNIFVGKSNGGTQRFVIEDDGDVVINEKLVVGNTAPDADATITLNQNKSINGLRVDGAALTSSSPSGVYDIATWTTTTANSDAYYKLYLSGTINATNGSHRFNGVFVNPTFTALSSDAIGFGYQPTVTSVLGNNIALWADNGGLTFNGKTSPSQITSNQNDYNPTGLHHNLHIRINSDASRDITGVVAGINGEMLVLHNVGAFNIVLRDENAGSSAANRFALNADITLAPDQSIWLWYDSTSSRWRAINA